MSRKKINHNMNKVLVIVIWISTGLFASAQQYLDAIVTQNGDTILGKIIEINDSAYTIDSYNMVFTINRSMISGHIPCFKEATRIDLMHMKPIDKLSNKDLYQYTSGFYLRKASTMFYIGLPLTLAGTTAIAVTLSSYQKPHQKTVKWAVFSGGVVAVAGGTFFLLKSFYLIDKAGKIMDLERSTLYLDTGAPIGIIWKF
jgi:hypothetical protein